MRPHIPASFGGLPVALAAFLSAACLQVHAETDADPLPVEDAAERSKLPLYQTIPAAEPHELTPTNGWPSMSSYRDWTRSGGGPTNARFSSLTQLNPENVGRLKQAWIYHSGDGMG